MEDTNIMFLFYGFVKLNIYKRYQKVSLRCRTLNHELLKEEYYVI